MQSKTIAKTIGRIGNRALIDFLLLKQDPCEFMDPQASISLGPNYGLEISLLFPSLLIEFSLLPLLDNTNAKFFDD